MEDRIVYLGPYNNDKKDELFNKSIYYLEQNKGDKFYYILPNGKLLVKYRNKMIEEVGQTFDINLFTFDDIVDKLLKNKFYTYIDGEMKEALLSKIFIDLNAASKLKYYKNISSKKGFTKVVGNIIGEIKRSLIAPKIYIDKSPNTLFYREIGLIYEEYEKWLYEQELIDREESFFKGLTILKEDNSFFDGLDFIVIDEFFDFRPQEMELLKEIAKTDCSIYINMPFNREENFNTLLKTIDILKDLGFKIIYVEKEELSYYEHIGNMVFSQKERTIKPNFNIYMIKASNSYLEIKRVSEEIKRYFIKGVDLKDIAIILVNPNEYKDIMFQVFEEERIPCSLNKDISLIEIPLIKEILHILEFNINKGNKTSIINRIKSNYFSLCNNEDKEVIEYILRKLQFDSTWELLNSDKLQSFNYASNIEKIIIAIEEESKSIPEKANIEEYVELIMNIIQKYNIEDSIINIYNLTKDYDLLYRDFAALNKFREVLTNFNNFTNILYDKITLEEFFSLLESYLQNESIVEVQGNHKGINILTPVTARGHKFKVLFIVGLSQGKYPNVADENFFFNEENYEELKGIGLDVKNYHEKLDKESLIFANILSTCTDKLYLSYSENSTGDEKNIPSMFLDEVLRIIEGEKLEEKLKVINVDMDYLLKTESDQLTTKKELSNYLLRKYYEEEEYDENQFLMYNHIDESTFKEVNGRILCEVERNKDEFNKYSGNIGDENIIQDIYNIHKDKIYSISYLESYAKCPYYFLLNNILKVEEMERTLMDFTPLDRGIITHDILKQYYSNYKMEIENHILSKEIFDVNKTYEYIINKMEEIMESMGMNVETNLWKLRIENNADRILNLVKADLDRLSRLKKKAIPVDFEVEFGRRKSFNIEVDDIKIPLTGVIDRIDKYVDEDKYIIIDYKNSDYNIKNIKDMSSGLSLQLPVYIMSQEGKEVVAAMYGIISKGEFELKIGNIEESHLVSKRNKGAITEGELEELLDITKESIKSYIDSIHKGNFSVNPMECSPFCIYKEICRYKGNMEVK